MAYPTISQDGGVPWLSRPQQAGPNGFADIGGYTLADPFGPPDDTYTRGVRVLVYALQRRSENRTTLKDPTRPPDLVRNLVQAFMNAGIYTLLTPVTNNPNSQGEDRPTLRGDADDTNSRVQQFLDDGLGPADPVAAKLLELGKTSFADQFVATPYPEGSDAGDVNPWATEGVGQASSLISARPGSSYPTASTRFMPQLPPAPVTDVRAGPRRIRRRLDETGEDLDAAAGTDVGEAIGGVMQTANPTVASQALSDDIPYPKPASPGAFRYLAPNRATGNIDVIDIDGKVIGSTKAPPDYPWDDPDTRLATDTANPKPVEGGSNGTDEAGAALLTSTTGELRPLGPIDAFFAFEPAGQALAGFGKSAVDFVPGLFNAGKELTVGGYDLLRYLATAQTARGSSAPYQPVSDIGLAIRQRGLLPVAGQAIQGTVTNLPGISTIGSLYHRDYGRAGGSVFDTALAKGSIAGVIRATGQSNKWLSAGDPNGLKYHAKAAEKGYVGVRITPNGGPTFAGTEYLFPVKRGQKNIVTLRLTGSRRLDAAAANEAAGLSGLVPVGANAPEGYVWHHVDDFNPYNGTATLELVQLPAHVATHTPRFGPPMGKAQWHSVQALASVNCGNLYENCRHTTICTRCGY